ncbi:MASE1 domain-containing protein [Streptomyces sp. NBC_01619]|uniref:MASE1 domain-containing protein n=1 Tax=Streptomyces sp. NBC_01619 TaxID=2975901 RepID=UPI002258FA2D|nr:MULTISPECIES: MASE1 domain-containing protein [unclassified Streptomyces]MCX4510966.1 MASE1 domain-containing protein [Streptomyces sp. NBC_01619]
MAAVARIQEIRRSGAVVLLMLAVAAVYFVAGRVGLTLQVDVGGAVVTPLWPPTGIALTCLLWFGLRVWPGIALGTFLLILVISPFETYSLGVLAGNTLAPVCAYLMLRRVGFRTQLDRLRDGLALVFIGALAGMLISATVGAGVLVLAGVLPTDDFWQIWSAWWAGDAMGVLVVTPLLLVCRTVRWPEGMRPARWVEAGFLLVSVAAVTIAVTHTALTLLFLVFPLLMWAALRFQLIGAAPCVLIVSVVAISAATDVTGPFSGQSLLAIMSTLQALNGSAALTGLLLSAIVTEQYTVRHKIELACSELAEVVDRLVPGSDAARRWPPPQDKGI